MNAIVVSVDYRLFPAVSFPVPIDDCHTAYQWAYDHATKLGADPNRYIVWGGSAGGALAVAVAYRLVTEGHQHHICGLVAMAPLCIHPDACPEKYKTIHHSYIENAGMLDLIPWDKCVGAYAAQGALPPYDEERNMWFPLALGSEAMKDMPPTYVINSELEVMAVDGRVLEAELKDAGVRVKRDVLPKLPHYYWSSPIEKAGEVFRQKLVDGFKWILGERS